MEKNNLVFRGIVGFVSAQEFGTDKKGNQFKKGYFIVGEPYGTVPNEIRIDWYNRKTSVDNLQVGDEVEVFYNLKCQGWNNKHIFSANLWKMNNVTNPVTNEEGQKSSTTENKYANMVHPSPQQSAIEPVNPENDLPF